MISINENKNYYEQIYIDINCFVFIQRNIIHLLHFLNFLEFRDIECRTSSFLCIVIIYVILCSMVRGISRYRARKIQRQFSLLIDWYRMISFTLIVCIMVSLIFFPQILSKILVIFPHFCQEQILPIKISRIADKNATSSFLELYAHVLFSWGYRNGRLI